MLKAAGINPEVLDAVLDFVPIVSNIKDAISAITGINPLTARGVVRRIAGVPAPFAGG